MASTESAGLTPAHIKMMLIRAAAAHKQFAHWPPPAVNALLCDIAEAVTARAEQLAAAHIAERGSGNLADQYAENRFASWEVYRALAGTPADIELEYRIPDLVRSLGVAVESVAGANTPALAILKTLLVLRTHHAVLLVCPPDAAGTSLRVGTIVCAVLRRHGAPADLVQWIVR